MHWFDDLKELEKGALYRNVRKLVDWVTEPYGTADSDGKKPPWEVRNADYLEKIKEAPTDTMTLRCADKTANIREMCY